jgi:cAMP-dependent protein kinase regulator
MVREIREGEIFGELSMLYNIPRTATVKAKKKSTLFKLDRKTFSLVLRRKNLIKRKIYTEVIDSVDLFKELNLQERIKLEDIIREMNVYANQFVIREGRVGNKLYIVLKGQLVALKKN